VISRPATAGPDRGFSRPEPGPLTSTGSIGAMALIEGAAVQAAFCGRLRSERGCLAAALNTAGTADDQEILFTCESGDRHDGVC